MAGTTIRPGQAGSHLKYARQFPSECDVLDQRPRRMTSVQFGCDLAEQRAIATPSVAELLASCLGARR